MCDGDRLFTTIVVGPECPEDVVMQNKGEGLVSRYELGEAKGLESKGPRKQRAEKPKMLTEGIGQEKRAAYTY